MVREKTGMIVIILLSIISIIVVFLQEPIAQDQSYHLFGDTRKILGIPNFWNVISNLPFFFTGAWGLLWIAREKKYGCLSELKFSYFTLFLGVSLVAVGSGYYHILPSNSSLVWDRLPMTIAFMALFSIIIGEFISVRLGQFLLLPLIIFGVFSVVYWHISEIEGNGDLRLYVLVQFLPVLLMPVILVLFKSVFTLTSGYWMLLGAYLIAKLLESFDSEIYSAISLLSGHSLKHIITAVGVYLLIWVYKHRVLT